MEITSSYGVKLLNTGNILRPTVDIYRKAVAYLVDVANKEWDNIGPVYKIHKQQGQRAFELLIHASKENLTPKYDFDARFYKFPSYFRRAALSAALGAVSSYRSSLRNWEESGKQGREPKLTYDRNAMPVFFKGNMSLSEDMLKGNSDTVCLKLFVKNDWIWIPIQCRHQDVKYVAKWWSNVKASAPVLEMERRKGRRHNVFHLRFAFKEKRDLSLRDEDLDTRTILAVDLGINNDAVCSVMRADGTVLARKFINFPREKDRLQHLLNTIRRQQRENGPTGGRRVWDRVNRINDQLTALISNEIVNMAVEYAVNVIVLEALDFQGKIKGNKKQRLHLWRKKAIQGMVERKAHLNLIRVSRVCAWGTSKLAFDGSGEILRGRINLSEQELTDLLAMIPKKRKASKGRPKTHCGQKLCTFQSGKEYNCDLSASYNIGARYFLREWCKVTPGLEEKLPKASQRTYADLKNLKLRLAA